jgi:hypothetical protein
MQPLIRRTITITVTETWTITWPDGHETVWQETQTWPADREPGESLPLITDDDQSDAGILALSAGDQAADDE